MLSIIHMAGDWFRFIGSGIACCGLTGAGIGIGYVFGSLILAMSKQPLLKGAFFSYALLGFALIEAIALFALMICFLILYS